MRRSTLITSAVLVVAALSLLFARGNTPPHAAAFPAAAHPRPFRPRAVPASAENEAKTFEFRHVVLNTAGDAPEICLKFSSAVAQGAEAHLADYIGIAPDIRASVQAQGDRVCVGGLAYGTEYTIRMKAGLPSSGKQRLAADESVKVSLGDRAPLVDISGDGFILPRAVAHGLTIQTVNVLRLRLHVLRVSDRLLPASVRPESQSDVQLDQTGMAPYAIRTLLRNSATVIWSGTMDIPADHNRTVLTAFPIGQVIKPGMIGAYLVVAEDEAHATPEAKWKQGADEGYSEEFYRPKATHWVIATNIALTTYTGSDGLHVSARSLADATVMPGVTLDLLSTGQDLLGEATTDDSGMAHFAPGLLRGQGAAQANTVVAHGKKGDFTLLDLTRPAFDFSDRGVTGRPSPAPLQAFLYTERGIYRPGQSVELMALLRDRVGDAAPLPLTVVLRRPNGMEANRFSLPGAPASGFHQTIQLSRTAPRGTWTLEALADPAGAAIGRTSFEVQDYVPQQLKVTLAPIAGALAAGAKLPIDVQGDFLYGAPASGLHGEADLKVTRDPEPVAAARGWQFGLADETVDDKSQTVDLPPADATGKTHADATLEMPAATVQSPLKVIITAGLFEPSGRQVTDSHEAKLQTRAMLIGLHARFADNRTDEGQEAGIDVRAFAPDGAPLPRKGLIWRLVREERLFDWFSENNGWHWHFHTEDQDVAQGTLDVPADAPATVMRRYDWGDYRLIVQDPASGSTSSIRFSAGWQETAGQADVPDKVHVAVDRESVASGQAAQVHIEGPFAGHASVVIANDRVIEAREVEIGQGGNTISVKPTAAWGAGAYVLVTVYRPLGMAKPHAPARAVGVAWIATDAAPRTLSVAIAAPEKVLPQRDVTASIHVGNVPRGEKAYVTLAAVDEGILQLTRFQDPDPVGFLFGKRALGIAMRDDYGKLLDGSADPGQIQGGDEGIGGAGLPVVSTRTVALFRGPVDLDALGNARIVLQPGDFEGQLRLMAVAYTAHGVGQAHSTMIVRDPVVADVAVPRFLASGDTASLAVSLSDTDGPPGAYHLKVGVAGAAELQKSGDFAEDLKPGQRISRAVDVAATSEGIADITADLTGPGIAAIHRSWQVSVRAAHAPITIEQTAWQQMGERFSVPKNLLLPFVPGSVSISLGYSAFGGIDVPSLLQSLMRYPYGCTEQLTSTAFPLVYYNDPALLNTFPKDQGVHDRVQDAIDTILDRQDENGEFGLWRVNDGEASTWLSVYALDFLTHAKEAGFAVPQSALDRSAIWLRRAADGHLEERAYKYYAQGALVTRAYANYVLARLGRADLGDLRRLHDTVERSAATGAQVTWFAGDHDVLEPLSLGQIAGAFSLMGDHARADTAFQMAVDNLSYQAWPRWWFDWSYASPLRDEAGLIAVAAETGQDSVLQPFLARFQQEHHDPTLLNTQEQAALLSAAHALNKGIAGLSLLVNGQPTTSGSTPSFRLTPASIVRGNTVDNTSGRALWRTLSVTGGPLEAAPALDAGYTIDKGYFTLKGDKLDPAHLHQNDRVIVALHGYLTGDNASHRTVLVDLLPAGWEIEAPIVKEEQYAFLGPLTTTRVKEARDDRFVAAFDFGSELREFRFHMEEVDDKKPHLDEREFRVAYVARAITPGHFTLPEAVVQDMYRPAFMARSVASTIDVTIH